MDYFLIFIIALLGTGFHVMQKIMALRAQFPQLCFNTIWSTFFQQDWDSLMVSGLILITQEVALFIVVYNQVKIPAWIDNWGMYVAPLVLNYGGQRIAYKYLNTSVDVLEKRADELKNKA